MKKNNSYTATKILLVFTIIFLISYPFHESFIGGLISGASGASVIGGLADWFAVTAIFRRPLGINWPGKIFRTEIIPKNRDRILDNLIDLIQNRILTKEILKNKLYNLNLSGFLLKYLKDKDTNWKIKSILCKIETEFFDILDINEAGRAGDRAIRNIIRNIRITEIISKLIYWADERGYIEKFIESGINESTNIVRSLESRSVIEKFVEDVLKEYEGDIAGRKLSNTIILNLVLKMTPSDIAKKIQDKAVDLLYEVKNPEHPAHVKIYKAIIEFSESIVNDSEFQSKFEVWKNRNIVYIPSMSSKISDVIENYKVQAHNGYEGKYLYSYYTYLRDTLERNSDMRNYVDLLIKKASVKLIDAKHHEIGEIVKNRLNEFSNADLVELIESTAGNDLQMIRINGSIVGGFVGILTYLVTFWIG